MYVHVDRVGDMLPVYFIVKAILPLLGCDLRRGSDSTLSRHQIGLHWIQYTLPVLADTLAQSELLLFRVLDLLILFCIAATVILLHGSISFVFLLGHLLQHRVRLAPVELIDTFFELLYLGIGLFLGSRACTFPGEVIVTCWCCRFLLRRRLRFLWLQEGHFCLLLPTLLNIVLLCEQCLLL